MRLVEAGVDDNTAPLVDASREKGATITGLALLSSHTLAVS
jgi:hypothetical protein